MLNALATIGFFILVWVAGTVSQYLYWQKVRKLIHGYAKDHEGYLGTGMCKIRFSRKAFVLVLADSSGIINGCYELKSLSLRPEFTEMPEMIGLPVEAALGSLPDERYHDAFAQALHVIMVSMQRDAEQSDAEASVSGPDEAKPALPGDASRDEH